MGKMSDKHLRKRDVKRNIGEELLRAVQQMKAGEAARVHRIPVSAITEARTRTGLSSWACRPELSKSGSKAAASHRVQRKRPSQSLPVAPKCCARCLPTKQGNVAKKRRRSARCLFVRFCA